MSASDQYQALQSEHALLKQRTSELSGDVTRLKKQLGEERKNTEALNEIVADNESLKKDLEAVSAQLKAAQSTLSTQQAVVARGEKAIAAGNTIAEALSTLATI